jgi:poly(hydroxyalkanoate) depolymerase family esterase
VFRLTARTATGTHRTWTRRLAAGLGATVLSTTLLAAAAPAAMATAPVVVDLPPPAATLTEVTGFGPNPTGLLMHLYVPPRVRPRPAVVVVLHYCTGSGPAMFTGTQFASLADRYGFLVIYPSAPREGHCFDVSSPGALVRRGNDSDPVGIVSMVRYVQRHRHADRDRVFVTGLSSGAMMTNVLLATHPDVFRAGSVMSGVPHHCFATTDGSMWNSTCAQGQLIRTAREWGDLVRGAFPGYHGPRPRVQIWHGTADEILLYPNFGEQLKQWTNVLRPRRVVTDQPQPAWTHTRHFDQRGRLAVDAYSVEGAPHSLGFSVPEYAQYAVAFFGLSRHGR